MVFWVSVLRGLCVAKSWSWRLYIPAKHWYTTKRSHGATNQKITINTHITMKNSNPRPNIIFPLLNKHVILDASLWLNIHRFRYFTVYSEALGEVLGQVQTAVSHDPFSYIGTLISDHSLWKLSCVFYDVIQESGKNMIKEWALTGSFPTQNKMMMTKLVSTEMEGPVM